jgi:transcriptional regulator with XRE-family HTH domain
MDKPDIWLINEAKLGKTAIINGQTKHTSPSVAIAYRCAKALNISIEELIDGEKGKEYLRGLLSKELRFPGVRADLADLVDGIEQLSPESLGLLRASVERFLRAEGVETGLSPPAASGGKNP